MEVDEVIKYKKVLATNIFTCMEMSKQSYLEIVNMPVQRFYDYLKWKTDLEEDRNKLLEEKRRDG